jgi:hypothetical protein
MVGALHARAGTDTSFAALVPPRGILGYHLDDPWGPSIVVRLWL